MMHIRVWEWGLSATSLASAVNGFEVYVSRAGIGFQGFEVTFQGLQGLGFTVQGVGIYGSWFIF
jgi:hypothetical protein